jgi:hypothetical protein
MITFSGKTSRGIKNRIQFLAFELKGLTNYIAKIMGIKRYFTLPIKNVQLVDT